jgi:hypothetical protein
MSSNDYISSDRPRNKVGRSDKTPFKHAILNAILGKMVGVIPYQQWLENNIVMLDLCAGDGKNGDHGHCSPSIMLKHAIYAEKSGIIPVVLFVEKDESTFSRLITNINPGDYSFKVILVHENASNVKAPNRPKENRFIHIDPNHAANMPSCEAWGEMMNERTFLLMTLGCNAGGLKRLPLAHRLPWYKYVEVVANWLMVNNRFDALFISIKNDATQWAYLVTIPQCWTNIVGDSIHSSAEKTLPDSMGVEIFSYIHDREGFKDCVNRHFLTAKEYNDMVNS